MLHWPSWFSSVEMWAAINPHLLFYAFLPALVFGTILSATDPVAVVALFNTLGVSPRLTMLISGESLINDGTAIVIFTMLLPQVCEHIDVEHEGALAITFAVL